MESRDFLLDTNGANSPNRGRLPGEIRSQILELGAEGFSPEEIAQRVGRSLSAVRKVLAVEDSLTEGPAPLDLDRVIDFLAELPEEAVQEMIQLAQLQRERSQLRSSLELRLRDLKKPV
jgi:hypothetical protein